MLKGIRSVLAGMLCISGQVLACDIHGVSGIVEENSLWIGPDVKSPTTITQERFGQILDRVERIYKPLVSEKGGNLVVSRNWDDGTVNAYAQQSGTTWTISMFGGLARHQTITEDGFALVACHEIGHHIGGAPKKASYFGSTWASNEGQSDYWGSMKCLRRYMEEDDNIAIVEAMGDIDATAKSKCEANFADAEEIAMCIRGSMAGLSLGNLFRDLRRSTVPLKFETPDPMVVTRTNDAHPASQCRLDTYFAGSVCSVDVESDVSNSNANQGVCAAANGHTDGLRPLCWFKPGV
jgi:hypothetical protein